MDVKTGLALHEPFMREALALAKRGLGQTSPNPAVGALIVRKGRVIARGYHRKAGLPHAEIEALMRAGKGSRGATLYVTLEPCCHFGRTPPCTDAIIRSGIKKVVTGTVDPNPRVMGRGIRILRSAGIEVLRGVLQGECKRLNAPYNKYIKTKMPFVTLKLAASLDGRIATKTGDSRWITGDAARRSVQKLRSTVDAVMVGVNTVLKDDPSLTARAPGNRENPARVIADTSFKTPLTAKVFKNIGTDRLIILTARQAGGGKVLRAQKLGAEVIRLRKRGEGVSLREALRKLGRLGITSLLVEGGGRLAASFIREGLADKACFFIAPVIIGGDGVPSVAGLGIERLRGAVRLKGTSFKKVGEDILVEGYLY